MCFDNGTQNVLRTPTIFEKVMNVVIVQIKDSGTEATFLQTQTSNWHVKHVFFLRSTCLFHGVQTHSLWGRKLQLNHWQRTHRPHRPGWVTLADDISALSVFLHTPTLQFKSCILPPSFLTRFEKKQQQKNQRLTLIFLHSHISDGAITQPHTLWHNPYLLCVDMECVNPYCSIQTKIRFQHWCIVPCMNTQVCIQRIHSLPCKSQKVKKKDTCTWIFSVWV